jgi:hypothetical protein
VAVTDDIAARHHLGTTLARGPVVHFADRVAYPTAAWIQGSPAGVSGGATYVRGVVLPVLSRYALGSFRTNDPRIRDFQQSGPVGREVVRHSSTLFGVSPELDGIIWHWELLPINEAT